MTNAEKYKEVFGLDPDTNTCPTMNCSDCPYRKDNDDIFPQCFNSSSGWWLSEYKEVKTNEDSDK